MTKRTIVNEVTITDDGTVFVRFAKQVIDDHENVLSQGWDRTSILPNGDVDAQMAEVNRHLVQIGEAPVDTNGIRQIKEEAYRAWAN